MEKEKERPQNNNNNSYIKYSAISFQMLAIILFFAFAGNKIDIYLDFEKPYITAFLALIGMSLAIYVLIRKI